MKPLLHLLQFIIALFFVSTVVAQEAPTGYDQGNRIADPKSPEFKFVGYWFTRSTISDVSPTNELLQGQIIGRMFGPNSTSTGKAAVYVEQRFVPMFIYSPQILDGVATFRSLFKIDMTWGDVAYGVGGNKGGALNAGQVNLQTLLANVDLHPTDAPYNFVIGLQRIFDNVRDPNQIAVSTAQASAYKLAYWGTQGVGLSMFGTFHKNLQYRLGYYQLYENLIQDNDDVSLWMVDAETRITPKIEVGADAWFIWDRAKSGGGISVLGQGLNSSLSEYNGGPRFQFPTSKYEANILWLGTHAAYNREFAAGRLWLDGFVMSNLGNVDTVGNAGTGSYGTIAGVAANAAVYYKYGQTTNDRISVEGLYTTGSANGSGKTISSVLTGNVYGSPTAIYGSHRALLLFPDPKVVNRYYSAVQDISNMGLGVMGLFVNASKDIVPNKFNIKAGAATAISNIALTGGGRMIGTELNVEAQYTYKVLLTFSLSAGCVFLGDFYDSPQATSLHVRPSHDPWVCFATMSWLMF